MRPHGDYDGVTLQPPLRNSPLFCICAVPWLHHCCIPGHPLQETRSSSWPKRLSYLTSWKQKPNIWKTGRKSSTWTSSTCINSCGSTLRWVVKDCFPIEWFTCICYDCSSVKNILCFMSCVNGIFTTDLANGQICKPRVVITCIKFLWCVSRQWGMKQHQKWWKTYKCLLQDMMYSLR